MRGRYRWVVRQLGAMVVVAGLVMPAGLSSGSTPPPRGSTVVPGDWVTTRYAGFGITIRHPPTWHSYPDSMASDGGYVTVGYLSTAPFPTQPRCSRADPRSCDTRFPHFAGDGVLVGIVSNQSLRGLPIHRLAGPSTEFAGRAAKVLVTQRPKFCAAGKAPTMVVGIGGSADAKSREHWWIAACFGPLNTSANEADFLTAVQTATIIR